MMRYYPPLRRILGDVFALAAGSLLPLAFAPAKLAYLAIISPALLLLILLNTATSRSFWRGFLYGVGAFGFGVSWVYISIHVYGSAPSALAFLITILFIAYLALFIATPSYLLNRFYPTNNIWKCCFTFPALWVLFEWLRSWLLTGFPWLLLGYSQVGTVWQSLAPIIGVYGVALVILFVAGALISCFFTTKWKVRAAMLFSIIALWFIAYSSTHVNWVAPTSTNLRVSLIQGNIPQELKWQPEQVRKTLDNYLQLTTENWDSNLIVWPEAAITINNIDAKEYLNYVGNLAKQHHATIIAGIPIFANGRYYNGITVLGDDQGEYRKRHLVPFGEFMPLRTVLNFLNHYIMIPMSDFSRGDKTQPAIIAQQLPIASFICYEIAYLNEILPALPQAQLLIVVSDDSWFGKSYAGAQHLQIAQLRALETGRYILFSTNDGITAIINPQGKLIATAPEHQQYVVKGQITGMQGNTPLVLIGLYPVLVLAFSMSISALILCRRKSKADANETNNLSLKT